MRLIYFGTGDSWVHFRLRCIVVVGFVNPPHRAPTRRLISPFFRERLNSKDDLHRKWGRHNRGGGNMASLNVPQPYPQNKLASGFETVAPISAQILPRHTRISFIQETRLFRGLSLPECADVASVAQQRRFTKGQIIFREGAPAQLVLVLVAGRVKMSQISRFGTEVIFRVEEAGDVLGGLGPSPNSRHRSTAQCLEPCHVLAWEMGKFSALEERIPLVRRNAMVVLVERLYSLEERFLELATERVAPRLAKMLLRLLEQGGRATEGHYRIDLSHEELAQMVGTTLFTVSRLFSDWEERGVVQSQRRAVVVVDPRALAVLAEAGSGR
jgi:CRP/FNR family transcriptional regulator, nitrogen oxide reductase regulator